MDGRRYSVSPRPCCNRRIIARERPRGDGCSNVVNKLRGREICSERHRAFTRNNAPERFRNIKLQDPGSEIGQNLPSHNKFQHSILVEFDCHDPKGHGILQFPFSRKRSRIVEIVSALDMVFALAQSGVCAAFSRETNQRTCYLNVSPDESLITVSVYAADNFSSLKCRTIRIECVPCLSLRVSSWIYKYQQHTHREMPCKNRSK